MKTVTYISTKATVAVSDEDRVTALLFRTTDDVEVTVMLSGEGLSKIADEIRDFLLSRPEVRGWKSFRPN